MGLDWVAGHRRVPPEAMEAAVAAARQQAEKVLKDCNARWTERANALETEAQRAQCRIVELEAAVIPEVKFRAGANARELIMLRLPLHFVFCIHFWHGL